MPPSSYNPYYQISSLLIMMAILLFADKTQAEELSGNAVIRHKTGDSEIVITTTNRLAGAIHSLTWNGKEFIDSFDHGRQLQSAASFDCARPGEFWAECFNPTEAGSRSDGAGPSSSSRLLRIQAQGNQLTTTTQMAYWLAPGQKYQAGPHSTRRDFLIID